MTRLLSNDLTQWRLKSVAGLEYCLWQGSGVSLIFTTRSGGVSPVPYDSLNLSFSVGDTPTNVQRNWSRVSAALGLSTVFTMRQVHGNGIVAVDDISHHSVCIPPGGDGCYTTSLDTPLGITIADCLPVYLFAPDQRGIGIAHCGWRGTVAQLAPKLACQLAAAVGIEPAALRFALGPCICPSCYTVGDDVAREFEAHLPNGKDYLLRLPTEPGKERFALDLRSANRSLLSELGLEEVASLPICTFENKVHCFSARRERTTGRNLACIVQTANGVGR